MNATSSTAREKPWVYAVLPVVILNLGSLVLFGFYYGLVAQQSPLVADISQDQLSFALYVFVFLVEWGFALGLLLQQRRAGLPIMELIAPGGAPLQFRWAPAAALFIAFNALFAAYVAWMSFFRGGWPAFGPLSLGQRLFLMVAVPIQAAFCEELIWRGYLITRFEAQGRKPGIAITLSAVSFALLHGLLLPDKLLVTFLLGIIAGLYFVRQRNLLPLMFTHLVVDVWSFGLSLFLGAR